jgi:hypothetical protein
MACHDRLLTGNEAVPLPAALNDIERPRWTDREDLAILAALKTPTLGHGKPS